MAKINAIFGKGTGKVGPLVLQINGGEQIMKEKPARVNNPNTPAQIEQRAKLKLMSQLAAALGGYLAFQKVGLKSARNQFISKNFPLCSYANNQATVDLEKLQLTAGSAFLPELNRTAAQGGGQEISLMQPAAEDIQSVRYILCKVNDDSQLSVIGSQLVTTPGDQRHFEFTTPLPNGKYVVYGYGIKAGAGKITTSYDNYEVDAGGSDAYLDVNALAKVAAGNLTKTSGLAATIGA